MTTVSVCMIVRNEEEVLDRALDSAWKMADEIVVFDTGSTDRTMDIAKGCHVLEGGDRMHKGQSRNQAIGAATGDWVVILDADETIADPVGVRDFLETTDAQAVYIKLAYVNGDGNHSLSYAQLRMWRRGTYQYKYRCHEIPLPVNGWGKTEYTDFVWEHRPPQDRLWKSQYTLDRLLLDIEENPGDARPLYYLGRQYFYRSEWQEAIDSLEKYLDMGGGRDAADAWYLLSKCYKEAQKKIDALHRACAIKPMRREWWVLLASIYHEKGQDEIATGLLKCALEIPKPKVDYYNPYWYGSAIYDLLARCLWKLGRYKEGHTFALKAVELTPGDQRLIKNLAYFEGKIGPKGPDYYDSVFSWTINDETAMNRIKSLSEIVASKCVGNVLDLGCGLGMLAEFVEEGYIGIDFSPVAISYAQEHYPHVSFVCGDIADTAVSADTVVLQEVLEHLDGPMAIINVARKYATKRIVVTVPINMPDPAHVKPIWTEEDIHSLFGDCEIEQVLGRYWLVVVDLCQS